jgi:hypothetical protein
LNAGPVGAGGEVTNPDDEIASSHTPLLAMTF